MSNINRIKEEIGLLRYNPAAIQRTVLGMLDQQGTGEYDLVDPSNPFVFLLEASSVMTSSAMVEAEALTRQQYGSMALTEDELYLHMSDKDFIGRFANPSRTQFTLLMSKEELFQRAVPTGNGSTRKLVVPRHTEFRVSDYVFTMQYPIELRVMGHGGIQVVYDVSRPSPLQNVETNVVDWSMTNIDQHEFLRITVPVNQFRLTTHLAKLNQASGYSKTFDLKEQYYHCRVYRDTNTGWQEIHTTHTDQVFDPLKPTVSLKVYQNKLTVTVPHVYLTTRMLDRELRIDVFTTKGPLDLILDNYPVNAFSAHWRDLDQEDGGRYTAPLSTFTNMAVFSDSVVVGGSDALSFEELRDRVIMNAMGSANLPITNVQLESRLSNLGYSVVKDVDNLTNRIFLASRQLPLPTNNATRTGISCLMSPYQSTLGELLRLDTVIDNGARATILPTSLYTSDNGVIRMLSALERSQLTSGTSEVMLTRLNEETLLYTPFHYVLDTTDNSFESRPYYLDRPEITGRQFVNENDSLGLQIATDDIVVERVEEGYRLRLVTRSGEIVKGMDDERLTVQLSFRPVGEARNVYINGTLLGRKDEERVYEFLIKTRYDINDKDEILLTNFQMFEGENRSFALGLHSDFDIAYYVDEWEAEGSRESNIDYLGAEFLLPENAIGIIHERVKLRLGWSLDGLWSNSRSIISSMTYRRYEEDVPAIHENNIYERDPMTGRIVIERNSDGSLKYNLLHKKGDPVLDSEGKQVYRHRKGEVITTPDGQPVIEDQRDILREIDLLLLDGRYRFATEEKAVAYRDSIPRTLVTWLREDIDQFRNWVLEQTQIYLYPQNTLGQVQVMVGEEVTRTVELEQSFEVEFYLARDKYGDADLRRALTEMAINTIAESLERTRITINDITSRMTARAGEDVVALRVLGLGGSENYPTMTLLDDSTRCSIRKRLTAMADGRVSVTDDVSVIFFRHDTVK